MNPQLETTGTDRPTSAANFHTRLARYRNLLARRWWVLLLLIILAMGVQTALIYLLPPKYVSVGRMIVSMKLMIPEGGLFTEELSNFLGTQAALMQSGVVQNRAINRVTAQKASLVPSPVKLAVSVLPKTTIFVLRGRGADPEYTQAYLEACMEEYSNLKKEMRSQTSDTTLAGLTEEVLRLEKELKKCDDDMVTFASTNSVEILQERGDNAGNFLALLNQRLASWKFEYELLKALSLDQNLERKDRQTDQFPQLNGSVDLSSISGRAGVDADYLRAKESFMLLKAEQEELGEFLRPQHPKMVGMQEELARRERLLEFYRQQSKEDVEDRKVALAKQIEQIQLEVNEWDKRVLQLSRQRAEYNKQQLNSQRIQALYDRLLATMQTLDVNKEINPESVQIMEKASLALPDVPELSERLPMAAILGLALGVGLLMLIDRLDDRLNSLTELAEVFDENVLAQVPRQEAPGKNGELVLLQPDDQRHGFLEAFRSIRSSLLYTSESGKLARTIVVTSSEPNDGKSMTAANLAITIAQGGARVLLVDADLRKGLLHERLKLASQPGLSEALINGTKWTDMVQSTAFPTLSFLARGATTQKSSELFLGGVAEKFLKEAAAGYDYVLVDTAPVMAADDVTSLAPHTDGVIFVIRAERTSARIARAALETLTRRRATILGLVFNAVRTTSGDYYHYYKYKDYYKGH